jgi:uncharacterized protein (TIGR00730 family)
MSGFGDGAVAPRVCVYCGSNVGSAPEFVEAAQRLGEVMARRSVGLVYGGGHVGLMGILADSVIANGGEVIGVITEQLVDAEVAHPGLTALEIVGTMHERKARFEQLSAGFIALPGGFGTVEEVFEMLTWNQLGIVHKPVVLLDVAHYWSPLFEWLDASVSAGFVRSAHRMLAQRARTVEEAIALAMSPVPDTPSKWLDRDTGPIPIIPRA